MKYGNRPTMHLKRIANSPVTVVIALILCFILGKAAWGVYIKAAATEVRLSQVQSELVKLEDRHKVLASKVSLLSTDEGVEAEMRTKYRAVKDGEFVAVIVDAKTLPALALMASTTSQKGLWARFWGWFGTGE
jgi:cell division protein FtsB